MFSRLRVRDAMITRFFNSSSPIFKGFNRCGKPDSAAMMLAEPVPAVSEPGRIRVHSVTLINLFILPPTVAVT